MQQINPADAAALISALHSVAYAGHGLAPVNPATAAKQEAVTLKDLLSAGLIRPGTDNVTLSSRGVTYTASLRENGTIDFQGSTFDTPEAFATRAKQLQLPDRESDNGWRSVQVDGVVLEDHRHAYLKGRRGTAQFTSETKEEDKKPEGASGSDLPVLPSSLEVPPESLKTDAPPAEAAEAEEGAGDATQQNWVQCSRCQVWRIVPDEFWPDIEGAEEEDWYCNEAMWDVTQYDPYTPACK